MFQVFGGEISNEIRILSFKFQFHGLMRNPCCVLGNTNRNIIILVKLKLDKLKYNKRKFIQS
jgi:hypothetical protein